MISLVREDNCQCEVSNKNKSEMCRTQGDRLAKISADVCNRMQVSQIIIISSNSFQI